MKSRQLEYYHSHRDVRINYSQEYREKNKELLNEKRRSKIWCETCELEISKGCQYRHIKSKKHLANVKLKLPKVIEEEKIVRQRLSDVFLTELYNVVFIKPYISNRHEDKTITITNRESNNLKHYNTLDIDNTIDIIFAEKHNNQDKKNLKILRILTEGIKADNWIEGYYNNRKIYKATYLAWKKVYNQLPTNNKRLIKIVTNPLSDEAIELSTLYP